MIDEAEGPDEKILTVSALRTALVMGCPKEGFEKGGQHEVTLAMKLLLDSSHKSCAVPPGEASFSCAAHQVFALDGLQWTDCPTCSSQ
jgi:hypothetical protein